jgi:glutamyl-tRNA synthetase
MNTAQGGPVRVRFAPSPTGYLHVGGARTAIYNELLRKSLGGALVLRIEDTDRERSDAAMTRKITDALRWLGVEWDEGPVLQSERLERHRVAARRLLAEGKAYRDFRDPEEVEAARRAAQADKVDFRYRSAFPPPDDEESERRAAAGEPFAVRFRTPPGGVRFRDLVRGAVEFPEEMLDDFVILRSDGSPTYHLSVVVDDAEMGITHVIRGEDHLSNTPKHLGLFAALGAEPPVFAHLPLILGPDKRRLSKRSGATSVEEFRAQGVLPEALYNYLVLLGWSPGDDREVMGKGEVVEAFTVDRLVSSAAVFDPGKLAWMNAQYMSRLPLETVLSHLRPFLEEATPEAVGGSDRLRAAVDLHRQRARNLVHLAEVLRPYFAPRLAYDPELCARYLQAPELPGQLEELSRRYGALEDFDIESLEATLRELAGELGVKAGVLIHPTRMALSGDKAGPPLFDLVAAMGREATLRHLGAFLDFLRTHGPET